MPDQWGRPTMADGFNIMRGVQSLRQMSNQQQEMDWKKEDRARDEQTDKLLGLMSDKVPSVDETGNPVMDDKGNPVTGPNKAGLEQYIAEQKKAGTFSNSAYIKAMATVAQRQSQDKTLQSQQIQLDIAKGHKAYEDARAKLGAIIGKKRDDWTEDDFTTLAQMIKRNPLTSFRVDEKTDGRPKFDKYGNLVFTVTNENGEKVEYKRPLEDAVQEILSYYPEEATKEQIMAWAARPKEIRTFNQTALQNPEYSRNAKGELAAVYTLKDRNGLPITYGQDDKTGELLFFKGDYDGASQNFKDNILTPDKVKDLPEKLGKEWMSAKQIEGRKKISTAGKPTLDETKKKQAIAKVAYDAGLNWFKTKGTTSEAVDAGLKPEEVELNATQEAYTTYNKYQINPPTTAFERQAYQHAKAVVDYDNMTIGAVPKPLINKDTKITPAWFKNTFSGWDDVDKERAFRQATPEQQKQIVTVAKGKETKGQPAKSETTATPGKAAKDQAIKAEKDAKVKKPKKFSKRQKDLLNYFGDKIAKENKNLSKKEIAKQAYDAYLKSEKKVTESRKEYAKRVAERFGTILDAPAQLRAKMGVKLSSPQAKKKTDWSELITD